MLTVVHLINGFSTRHNALIRFGMVARKFVFLGSYVLAINPTVSSLDSLL
jgi:hypothetical protein